MKRIISTALVLLMTLALLAGCARVPAANTAEPAAAEATEAPAQEEPSPEPTEEPIEGPAEEAADTDDDMVLTYSYETTYAGFTAKDGHVYVLIQIDFPERYGLTSADGSELIFEDGTRKEPTMKAKPTDLTAEGKILFIAAAFLIAEEQKGTFTQFSIDGQLFDLKEKPAEDAPATSAAGDGSTEAAGELPLFFATSYEDFNGVSTPAAGYIFAVIALEDPSAFGITAFEKAALFTEAGEEYGATFTYKAVSPDDVMLTLKLVFAIQTTEQESLSHVVIDGVRYGLSVS